MLIAAFDANVFNSPASVRLPPAVLTSTLMEAAETGSAVRDSPIATAIVRRHEALMCSDVMILFPMNAPGRSRYSRSEMLMVK
ncbi:hypothetical protein AB1M95_11555 [Sulfitobacter sp. LCG007]